MSGGYILDACALIALASDEDGAGAVAGLLEKAERREIDLYMSKINLLEVYYGFRRDLGLDKADEVFYEVMSSPIQVLDTLDNKVFAEAGRIKSSYKVSLADSIALAYASVMECALVTSDHHELDFIERSEKIGFFWFR